MKNLRGKKALVTGAGSGIGLCITLELARAGVDVVLADIDAARLESAVAQARALGVQVAGIVCDLSQPAEVTRLGGEAIRVWDGIDILVNNAGIAYFGPTELMTAEQWNRLLQINLLTPVQLTRELLPHLLEREESHVLNVCSILGLVAARRVTAYCTSKFGLVGFTLALRAEIVNRGFSATALCPGLVRTNIFASAGTGDPNKPVKAPSPWISITPERVARAAVKAIRRDKSVVVVSYLAQLLYFLKRMTPGLLDSINRFSRKKVLGKKAEKPQAPAESSENESANRG